jgi:protein-arginine kinase activator protein McsA
MKEDTIFLALLLSRPKHPGRDIDIILKPLIDELKNLWVDGKETYDVSTKQYFIMNASLLWTVSDFSAYEMLSGWGTHGRLACPYCMGATKAFRLPNGGKPTWFGCHRCYLEQNHEFRSVVHNFIKDTVNHDPRPPTLTGEQVLEELNELEPIT